MNTLGTALLLPAAVSSAATEAPEERPASPGEWGFRPREKQLCAMNRPGFVARPQRGADRPELLRGSPREYPRVFVPPVSLPDLKGLAAGSGAAAWKGLVREAEKTVLLYPARSQ